MTPKKLERNETKSGRQGHSFFSLGVADWGWCQVETGVAGVLSDGTWNLNAASGKVCRIADFDGFFETVANLYFSGGDWEQALTEAGFYALGEDE